jgi:uncharacterized protein YdeI (BOF family)
LNNDGDMVRLLYPDGSVADKIKYTPLKTNQAFGRAADGRGTWRGICLPTPGAPNCAASPPPTATRALELVTIAEARAAAPETRVSVSGSVVARPCELDTYGHAMTLSDGNAGIAVYLAYPERFSCLIPRGEQVAVTGIVRDHFGLRTIYPTSNLDLVRHYGAPRVIAPVSLHTGDLGESVESMAVLLQGTVANGRNGRTLWVNDGSGAAELYADESSGTSFEGIPRGSRVRLSGIVYQYNAYTAEDDGFSLRVRNAEDVLVLERAEPQPRAPGGRGTDIGAVSIAGARQTRLENYVTIGGTVTVPPGVIAPRDFWIQDADGGIRVTVARSAGEVPALAMNQMATVRGRVVMAFGARIVRVELPDAIHANGTGNAALPRRIQTGSANFGDEGMLVEIEGFVSSARGRELFVDDGTGELRVYIDANTKIRGWSGERGTRAHIVGVLARFQGAPEILPRFPEDLQFGSDGEVRQARARSSPRAVGVRGRVGEPLEVTRRVRGDGWVAVLSETEEGPGPWSAGLEVGASEAVRLQEIAALASGILLVAAGVFGVGSAQRYRAARRRGGGGAG